MRFKKGDIVKCIANNIYGYNIYNKIGRIICIDYDDCEDDYDAYDDEGPLPYAVEFNEFINGGNCWGYGKYGYCCWMGEKHMVVCNPKARLR